MNMIWKRVTHLPLYAKLLILAGLLLVLSVSSAVAGTIANHDISGSIWYHKTSTDTTLRYVWKSQSASPSYEFRPHGFGTFHLYNGYNPSPLVVTVPSWSTNWNWTTCYKGSEDEDEEAGSLNIWCRRTA